MSHFAVAIITEEMPFPEDIEKILAPFSENLEVEKYYEEDWSEEDWNSFLNYYYGKKGLKAPETLEGKKKAYETHGVSWDGTGNSVWNEEKNNLERWSTYNPKSKWDWYAIGGRWNNLIKTKLKPNGTNVAKLSDVINLIVNRELADWKKQERLFKVISGEIEATELEDKEFKYLSKEYYIKKFGNAETYADETSVLRTYAILLPTGEWVEPGSMGAFGISSASSEEEINFSKVYLDKLKPYLDTHYITIVDCHI